MRSTGPAITGADVRLLLTALSEAFENRDLAGLLDSSGSGPDTTYSGSEAGEVATGRPALRLLFLQLLARDGILRFTFDDVRWACAGDAVWIWADGHGTERRPGHGLESFPSRVAGAVMVEDGRWRWTLLTGAEPTPAASDAPAPAAAE